MEYDGWTELEHTGYIVPLGEVKGRVFRYPAAIPWWIWEAGPSIDPVYFVTYSRVPGLRDAPFPVISYRAWLPPFHRQVLTQTVAPATP
jgi:hypothetical protein